MSLAGVARWTDPAWRAEHLAWAEARLAEHGHHVVAEPEQRARPWSTVFRLDLADGRRAWSKATGPGTIHEAALLAWLHDRRELVAQAPLAVDVGRGWLLTQDGGTTLRETAAVGGRPVDQDLKAWAQVLPAYAGLQRRVAGETAALLALGVPDDRPARYPETLAGQLDDAAIWTRVDAADREQTNRARGRLRSLLPLISEMADELAVSPVAASLDHGDLHGNNVLVGPDGSFRLFDWGDAVVAHPFATLTTTLGSVAHHAGLALDGPELARLRDGYLEAWTDVASRAELTRAAELAVDLGHLGKAAAWERALMGLEPAEMDGFHGWTAGWLAEAVARLERRAAPRG